MTGTWAGDTSKAADHLKGFGELFVALTLGEAGEFATGHDELAVAGEHELALFDLTAFCSEDGKPRALCGRFWPRASF